MLSNAKGKGPGGGPVPAQLKGEEIEFFFPEGLLGLASCRHFTLSPYRPPDRQKSPFFLLRAKDTELSFPLISPHLLLSDFRLSPASEVLNTLGAGSAADLTVLVIVTLRDRLAEITANLQGPLLLNPVSHMGLQLVAEHHPVRYPLLKKLIF